VFIPMKPLLNTLVMYSTPHAYTGRT